MPRGKNEKYLPGDLVEEFKNIATGDLQKRVSEADKIKIQEKEHESQLRRKTKEDGYQLDRAISVGLRRILFGVFLCICFILVVGTLIFIALSLQYASYVHSDPQLTEKFLGKAVEIVVSVIIGMFISQLWKDNRKP